MNKFSKVALPAKNKYFIKIKDSVGEVLLKKKKSIYIYIYQLSFMKLLRMM